MENIKLELNNLELVTMSLHLNLMRHSIKKGFKKTYNKFERKNYMEIYDAISDKFGEIIGKIDDLEKEIVETVEIEKGQVELLYSFLEWYSKTLASQEKKQKANLEGLEIFTGIFEKVKEKRELMYLQQV